MHEPHDPNLTIDIPSVPADSLDAGLAAGFGKPAQGPRSSLADMRPVLLKEAEGESAHVLKPKTDAMPTPEQLGDRYQLQGEIARGGMGAVLRGRDVDLGRDLAVKVLLEQYADRPDVARRFIEEAQIGGQLQHPGVVPVYDIGRFGQRPFFTMKLVKGQTLAALLGERADPAVDRPRFLAIALQVAQTIAYAHAKGVIHRDLKPANIMVGAFGEVQVMDWGLAKVLAEGGVADEEKASRERERPEDLTTIRTARSSGSTRSFGTDTEAGSLLGTPAYMPPEQANGDVANLDRRADVFGLGAILCEILTGKPPYVGRSSEEVRRKAANGDLADAMARLDACGADLELISLTTTCLAAEAIDRPKNAQEVADGLSSYLNGVQERLQAAERERAVAVAREAEQRKRRKVQLALAAAVLGLVLGGGAFAWWRNAQAQAGRERDARNAEAVAALLDQAEEALVAGDAAKAALALDAATKRSAEGGAEQEAERLGRLTADLALVRDLDAVDQFRWTWAENKRPDPVAVATRTREALARFGADPEAVSADDVVARVSASVVQERIVSALDRLLRQQKAAVRAVLRRVDAHPFRDEVRDAILANDRAKFVELEARATALEQPPGFVAFLGEIAVIDVERRRQLLAVALRRWPGNPDLLMTLGESYPINQEDGANERLRWFQAAAAAAPAMPAAYNGLGLALRDKNDLIGAEAAFRKAIELDPKLAGAHNNLAIALISKGQDDEAIACCRRAIELDPTLALAHNNLGIALSNKGQQAEAIACYNKAIDLDPHFANPHANLGVALKAKGRLDEAIAHYQEASKLNPKDAGMRSDLGNALKDKGLLDQAIGCYRKAIELDPKLARAHSSLGNALADKGHVDEAIACQHKAIELDPKFAAAYSNLGWILCDFKRDFDGAIVSCKKAIELDPKNAAAHNNLGLGLSRKGRVDEAITCYKKAIELDPKYAAPRNGLGAILCYTKCDYDGAIASLRKAIELDPKRAIAHRNLGNALANKGKLDEAIACWHKAIELNPKGASSLNNLANALAYQGKLDEAIAYYQKAIALEPRDSYAHNGLGVALRGKGRVDEAIACYKRAIELDPKYATAHNNLGNALKDKGQLDEAIACYRKAIALDPKDVLAHSNLGVALEGKGRLDDAISSYKKAVELDPLDPKLAVAHNNLGWALLGKGQVDEAITCFKKAIELDPKVAVAQVNLARAKRMAPVRDKVSAFQNGKYTPANNDERISLAEWCWIKKLYHRGTRLYAAVFAADPKLADDLEAGHRYNAVCYAALAAAGQGEDATKLDDKERTRLRQQARDWLRADLVLHNKQMESGKRADRASVHEELRHWQQDTDLAGIRNAAAVAKLPAEERAACERLWADVAALLKKTETPTEGKQ